LTGKKDENSSGFKCVPNDLMERHLH